MTQPLHLVRQALTPLLALVALLAFASTAQAAITVQPLRSLDAQEGSVVPRDRIVLFEDAGACAPGEFTVTINWGDGTSSPGEITFTDEVLDVNLDPVKCTYGAEGGHTYRTAATAPLTATITRGAETVQAAGGTARVAQAPLTGEATEFSAHAGSAFTGRVARFRDENELAQASDYTAVVDWGDGSSTPATVTGDKGRFEIEGAHTYAAQGRHTVRVTLVENGAARLTVQEAVDVEAPEGQSAGGAAAGSGLIVANSARNARGLLRLSSGLVTRRALRRGLRARVALPASVRTVRVAIVKAGARPKTVGTVLVKVRGGRVSGGVRTVDLRIPLSVSLRRKLRAGSYAVQLRVAGSGLLSAPFRVQ